MASCLCFVPNEQFAAAQAKAAGLAKIQFMPPAGALAKIEAAAKIAEDADLDAPKLTDGKFSGSTLPPSIDARVAGQLVQLAATVKMTGGTFTLFDPIKLKAEMANMAVAVNQKAPMIAATANVKATAMAKVVVMARAVIKLKAMGLDPEDPGIVDKVAAKAKIATAIRAQRPKIAMTNLPRIKAIAALPTLVEAMEQAEIPVGARPEQMMPMLMTRIKPLLAIQPPQMKVSVKMMLAAAVKLEETAKIEEAFGDATPGRFRAIAMNLQAAATMAMRLNVPPVVLEAELPTPAEIRAGEEAAKHPLLKANFKDFAMPTLQIMPPIQAFLALRAALALQTKLPPVALCSQCGM